MKPLFLSFVFAMILAISPAVTYSGGGDGVPNPDAHPTKYETGSLYICGLAECWIAGELCFEAEPIPVHHYGYNLVIQCFELVIRPD